MPGRYYDGYFGMAMNWFKKNGFLALLILIAFSLPFTMLSGMMQPERLGWIRRLINFQWNSFFILLLMVYWLLEGHWVQKIKQCLSALYFWLFAGVYAVYVIGLLYTETQSEGQHELILKSTFLIFPCIFLTIRQKLTMQQFEWILWSFCLAVIIASLITFREGFTVIIDQDSGIPVLEKLVILHRPYLGMYIVFVMIYLLGLLYNYQQKNQEKYIVPLLMYLLIFLLMLRSRVTFIAFLLTLLTLITLILYQRKRIIELLLSYTLLFLLVFQNYYVLENAVSALTDIYLLESSLENRELVLQKEARSNIWQCVEAILQEQQAYVWGVGTGDAQKYLLNCYQSREYAFEFRHELNAHNEFLQEILRHGIFGLCTFFMFLAIPFWKESRRSNHLYTAFILIFCICSFTESLLSRQSGVVFFTFFNALLLFKPQLILAKSSTTDSYKI